MCHNIFEPFFWSKTIWALKGKNGSANFLVFADIFAKHLCHTPKHFFWRDFSFKAGERHPKLPSPPPEASKKKLVPSSLNDDDLLLRGLGVMQQWPLCTQAACGPSRTSFLTSRRPDRTRCRDSETGKDREGRRGLEREGEIERQGFKIRLRERMRKREREAKRLTRVKCKIIMSSRDNHI